MTLSEFRPRRFRRGPSRARPRDVPPAPRLTRSARGQMVPWAGSMSSTFLSSAAPPA